MLAAVPRHDFCIEKDLLFLSTEKQTGPRLNNEASTSQACTPSKSHKTFEPGDTIRRLRKGNEALIGTSEGPVLRDEIDALLSPKNEYFLKEQYAKRWWVDPLVNTKGMGKAALSYPKAKEGDVLAERIYKLLRKGIEDFCPAVCTSFEGFLKERIRTGLWGKFDSEQNPLLGPLGQATGFEEVVDLKIALGEKNPAFANLFHLNQIEGLNSTEIAKRINSTPAAASRALQKIKWHIEEGVTSDLGSDRGEWRKKILHDIKEPELKLLLVAYGPSTEGVKKDKIQSSPIEAVKADIAKYTLSFLDNLAAPCIERHLNHLATPNENGHFSVVAIRDVRRKAKVAIRLALATYEEDTPLGDLLIDRVLLGFWAPSDERKTHKIVAEYRQDEEVPGQKEVEIITSALKEQARFLTSKEYGPSTFESFFVKGLTPKEIAIIDDLSGPEAVKGRLKTLSGLLIGRSAEEVEAEILHRLNTKAQGSGGGGTRVNVENTSGSRRFSISAFPVPENLNDLILELELDKEELSSLSQDRRRYRILSALQKKVICNISKEDWADYRQENELLLYYLLEPLAQQEAIKLRYNPRFTKHRPDVGEEGGAAVEILGKLLTTYNPQNKKKDSGRVTLKQYVQQSFFNRVIDYCDSVDTKTKQVRRHGAILNKAIDEVVKKTGRPMNLLQFDSAKVVIEFNGTMAAKREVSEAKNPEKQFPDYTREQLKELAEKLLKGNAITVTFRQEEGIEGDDEYSDDEKFSFFDWGTSAQRIIREHYNTSTRELAEALISLVDNPKDKEMMKQYFSVGLSEVNSNEEPDFDESVLDERMKKILGLLKEKLERYGIGNKKADVRKLFRHFQDGTGLFGNT